jgi:hypothetical protein
MNHGRDDMYSSTQRAPITKIAKTAMVHSDPVTNWLAIRGNGMVVEGSTGSAIDKKASLEMYRKTTALYQESSNDGFYGSNNPLQMDCSCFG